jgi:pimeloyl-ACP methyl ester carboxylesterase
MSLIKTKSFTLAIRTEGDKNASKVVIMLPGRLDSKDYANFVSHMKYLAGLGFYAVSVDPPGTWESPGPIDLFTTTNYIKAVNELIDYLGNKPTLLLGHSRGGSIAILTGVKNPNVVGLVLVMASYKVPSPPSPEAIKQGFNLEYRELPPGTSKASGQKEFRLPLSYFEDGQKYNAGETIKSCTKPKLMIGSVGDKYTSSSEFEIVYQSTPEPKMRYELSCGHNYRFHPDAIEEVNKTMGEFIDKIFN